MKNAFSESFNRNSNRTLIIGSDLLDLNENYILAALENSIVAMLVWTSYRRRLLSFRNEQNDYFNF